LLIVIKYAGHHSGKTPPFDGKVICPDMPPKEKTCYTINIYTFPLQNIMTRGFREE